MDPANSSELKRLLKILVEESTSGTPVDGEVFNLLLKVMPQPNVEFVVCRKRAEDIEVLLFQRPSDLPQESYPSQWHCPGTFFRTTDTSIATAYERIRIGKMRGTTIKSIRFLDFQLYVDKTRGSVIVRLVHLVEIEGVPVTGQWFKILPTPDLPTNLVWDQPQLLRAAVMFDFRDPAII